MSTPTLTLPALNEFQVAFLTEWATDLKTTDARQGPSNLCRRSNYEVDQFCCLGRAGLLLKDNHAEWLKANDFMIGYRPEDERFPDSETLMFIRDLQAAPGTLDHRGNDGVLPDRLAELLGFDALGLAQQHFYTANDDNDRTFLQIGDAIDMALSGDPKAAETHLDYEGGDYGDPDEDEFDVE